MDKRNREKVEKEKREKGDKGESGKGNLRAGGLVPSLGIVEKVDSFFPFSLIPFISLFLALLLGLILVNTATAQEPAVNGPTADEVNQIAKGLYCPVCPNTPLDVCETKACEDWRALIRDKLAAGESEAAIREYFVAQYGTRVLAAPPRRGLTTLVWLIPPLGVVAGGWIFWRLWRSRRGEVSQSPAVLEGRERPPIPAEYLARLEEDVRKG